VLKELEWSKASFFHLFYTLLLSLSITVQLDAKTAADPYSADGGTSATIPFSWLTITLPLCIFSSSPLMLTV
jgi:hypothetical protein